MLRTMLFNFPSSLWLNLHTSLMPHDSQAYVVSLFATGLLITQFMPNAQEMAVRVPQPMP